MSIQERWLQIKTHMHSMGKRWGRGEAYTVVIIILVGCASFGLGRLSKIADERPPVTISEAFPSVVEATDDSVGVPTEQGRVLPAVTQEQGQVVGSRNGTKYHLPWCPGAQQIKEENKVWFATRAEAEQAGYTPAANCKGL